MLKRIALSLLAFICALIIIFVPYYIGESTAFKINASDAGELNPPITWLFGLIVSAATIASILLIVGWLRWIFTGKVFDK